MSLVHRVKIPKGDHVIEPMSACSQYIIPKYDGTITRTSLVIVVIMTSLSHGMPFTNPDNLTIRMAYANEELAALPIGLFDKRLKKYAIPCILGSWPSMRVR